MIYTGGEIHRGNLQQVLATWFAADQTVVLESYDGNDSEALSLPRQAATVSAYWAQRTAHAHTMGEWREVYKAWKVMCPRGLLLGPDLWDLDDPSAQESNDPPGPLPDDAPFSVFQGIYDVAEGAGYTIQPQLAQDAWVPSEWAEELGQPDHGFGIDYEPAEFKYAEPKKLLSKLAEYGIATISAPELVHAVWDPYPLPANHEVLAWEPTPVDQFGNPAI
jgi:hypothetical protein